MGRIRAIDNAGAPVPLLSLAWPRFYWRTNVWLDCRMGLNGDRECELVREREREVHSLEVNGIMEIAYCVGEG